MLHLHRILCGGIVRGEQWQFLREAALFQYTLEKDLGITRRAIRTPSRHEGFSPRIEIKVCEVRRVYAVPDGIAHDILASERFHGCEYRLPAVLCVSFARPPADLFRFREEQSRELAVGMHGTAFVAPLLKVGLETNRHIDEGVDLKLLCGYLAVIRETSNRSAETGKESVGHLSL